MNQLLTILSRPIVGRVIIAIAAAAGGALLTFNPDVFAAFCSQ